MAGCSKVAHVSGKLLNLQEAVIKIKTCLWTPSAECIGERQPLLEQLAAVTVRHSSRPDGRRQVTRETEQTFAPIFESLMLVKYETRVAFVLASASVNRCLVVVGPIAQCMTPLSERRIRPVKSHHSGNA